MTTVSNPTQWLGKALDIDICGGVKGQKESEFLKMLLLECAENTHLPELCQVLGPDVVLKLFDCFSGATIKIPNRETVVKAIRDTTIFFTLWKTQAGQKYEAARHLAGTYEITPEAVRAAYIRVKSKYENFRDARCLNTK